MEGEVRVQAWTEEGVKLKQEVETVERAQQVHSCHGEGQASFRVQMYRQKQKLKESNVQEWLEWQAEASHSESRRVSVFLRSFKVLILSSVKNILMHYFYLHSSQ